MADDKTQAAPGPYAAQLAKIGIVWNAVVSNQRKARFFTMPNGRVVSEQEALVFLRKTGGQSNVAYKL